jgi:hypothetical protein
MSTEGKKTKKTFSKRVKKVNK